MKRCSNPNCESAFLFGKDRTICPFCRSRLVDSDSSAEQEPQNRAILPPDRVIIRGAVPEPEPREFMQEHSGTVECHGRIVEIEHQEFFNSRRHKLLNSLLRGEPYQFARQTVEYAIRVENITEGFPTEITDFCLYGSYLGRLQVGDEVTVRARKLDDRRVVKSVYNETTNSAVRPGLQVPAGFIRGVFLTAAVIIIAFICELVWLFESGAVMAGLASVTTAVMPVIIVCIGIWMLIRSVFPRRRN